MLADKAAVIFPVGGEDVWLLTAAIFILCSISRLVKYSSVLLVMLHSTEMRLRAAPASPANLDRARLLCYSQEYIYFRLTCLRFIVSVPRSKDTLFPI